MSQRPAFPLQPNPPLSPRETLPTMYDLPSENPEEPGLPDEFHDLQPQLLSATLRLRNYAKSDIFTGTDLNLYYDVRHPQWYKRPDWFLVLGVPRLYDGTELRSSYVLWQEGVDPFVVVELLSPGTETEDLGNKAEPSGEDPSIEDICLNLENGEARPPRKWEVYEQILRVPYYCLTTACLTTALLHRIQPLHQPASILPACQRTLPGTSDRSATAPRLDS